MDYIEKIRQDQSYYLQYDCPEIIFEDLIPDNGIHTYTYSHTRKIYICHMLGGRWRWISELNRN